MFQNILLIFRKPLYSISYIILVIILGITWYKFTDLSLMRGNYGQAFLILDIIVSWINILGFPLFILAWIFRANTFGFTKNKKEGVGFIGGIIGVLISGSLCCGTSLLLPLGASLFIDFFSKYLRYNGMELKILGVAILLYGIYSLLKNLLICQVVLKK